MPGRGLAAGLGGPRGLAGLADVLQALRLRDEAEAEGQ